MARPHGFVCIIIIKVSSGAIIATVAHRTWLVGCEFRQQSSSTVFVAAHIQRRRMVRDPVTCMPTWIPSAFSGCLCQSAVGWLHKYINTFYVARVILPSCKYVHTSGEKLLWCVWPKSQEDLVRGGSNQITYHTHHLARMKKYSGRTWMVSSRKHICVLVRILRTFVLLLHGQRSLDDELYFIKLWSILMAINFDFQFNLWGAENKTHKRKVPQLPPVAKRTRRTAKKMMHGSG